MAIGPWPPIPGVAFNTLEEYYAWEKQHKPEVYYNRMSPTRERIDQDFFVAKQQPVQPKGEPADYSHVNH